MGTPSPFRALWASAIAIAMASAAVAESPPPDSPEARKIVALVGKAASLVEERGKAVAFAEFRKQGSEWLAGDTYLFAYDLMANVLLNAAFPKREGTNVAGQKDVNGKLCHDEIIQVVASKGSGWVECTPLPRPGQTKPARKWVYAKRARIDGTAGLVASGFYPE